LQFAILMSQHKLITQTSATTVQNYNPRDATVQVLVGYTVLENESPQPSYTGTGTIIYDDVATAYVLTAKHVCHPNDPMMVSFFGYEQVVEIQDIDGSFHYGEIVLLSAIDDLCVIKYRPNSIGTREVASFSSSHPKLDSRAYMYAAPAGFYVPSAITQFSGVFSGNALIQGIETGVYSIPAAGGASGAAIVNQEGEIIGVLHSTLREFHHISLATTYSSTIEFIEELEIQEGIKIID